MIQSIKTPVSAAQVKALAAASGISDTGICSAKADTTLLARLEAVKTPFVPAADKRIAPADYLPDAKSVIVCAFHYANPKPEKTNLSCYAWGKDYHDVVKAYLTKLLEQLKTINPATVGYIFTDDAPLCNKALAYRAGLGFFGRNSLLIHPVFGSYFFIGGIVTNLSLETDTPHTGSCGNCRACAQVCPAGLCIDGWTDGYKCISYLQQKKGDLTDTEADLIRKSGSVWGCDLCQSICPHNQKQTQTAIPEFAAPDAFLPPALTEESFNKNYRDRAFFWRGYSTLQRNLRLFEKS